MFCEYHDVFDNLDIVQWSLVVEGLLCEQMILGMRSGLFSVALSYQVHCLCPIQEFGYTLPSATEIVSYYLTEILTSHQKASEFSVL